MFKTHLFFHWAAVKTVGVITLLAFTTENSANAQETPQRFQTTDPTAFQALTISDGCEAYVVMMGDPAILESKDILLVKRPKYQYWLQIERNTKGTIGKLRSVNGEIFQPSDELMLFNTSREKMHFKYQEISEDGRTAYFNLDGKSIQQMAAAKLESAIFKSVVNNKILKFEIELASKDLLNNTMECFSKMGK